MYTEITSNENIKFYDLVVRHYGLEKCMAGHHYGPGARDVYLLHYIMSGSGVFKTKNKSYNLNQGQGFMIFPDTEIEYYANEKDPWTYCWVGFEGIKVNSYLSEANLNTDNPIFTNTSNAPISKLIIKLIDNDDSSFVGDIKRLSILLNLMSYLIKINTLSSKGPSLSSKKELIVNNALEYIDNNYSMNISISDISNYLDLNKNYLGTIFKEKTNTTLQSTIIKKRVSKACELMLNENHSISDISHSVGYSDPFQFSKTFKKFTGVPPSVYRKSIL